MKMKSNKRKHNENFTPSDSRKLTDNSVDSSRFVKSDGKKPDEGALRLAREFAAPTKTDPLGSYTGNTASRRSAPQQDADDL